ncbi:MAG TPA: cytochrome c oxidase subunit 3 [Verrucomicrobiae bacterium]|jgi:cytochrome c oxidase subunit 3|nr:cytochrome c oxidase subunit 3 [Verrucomicrobiae bacterium]
MEIPYAVKPRPDTGLYNAKVGIWLFLASEVMLFGALFCSYILLRVNATDWPHHWLNIWLGMTNTIVLILSSVTVVLSWSELKMGRFNRYRFYQAITIICALVFLGIKSFEYHDKFIHYQVILKDGTMIDGHLQKETTMPVSWHEQPVIVDGKLPRGAKDTDMVTLDGWYPPNEGEVWNPPLNHEDKKIEIPANKIKFMENYGPWHTTYTAIYFTLTGLHALHVIAGAIVIFAIWGPLAKVWEQDPERYTNRVEVSGLFWHFVDLVWIFLFPVLYLL